MTISDWGKLCAGLVLTDKILFPSHFFKDQLSLGLSKEQKLMMCDNSRRVLFCTGRKIAKSIRVETFIIQAGILHRAIYGGVDEGLVWTPNDVHMAPIVDRVFSRIERSPLFRGCVVEKGLRRGENTILEFRNGLRWYFRIEGSTGTDRNAVGLRAKYLLGDEQAFGQHVVYNSLIQTALPTAKWLMAGVPNGVRKSPFYELDQTDKGKSWSRHKWPTFINPLFSGPDSRQQLADDYGGEKTQGFITQVLGEWGEEMFTSFPAGSIAIGDHKFFNTVIEGFDREDLAIIARRVAAASIRCKRFILSLDYGYSPDPSILGGFYSDDDEAQIWRQFLRVKMVRVAQPHQIEVVLFVKDSIFHGQFMGFASDHAATVQLLQSRVDQSIAPLFVHTSPGASTPLDMSEVRTKEPDLYRILSDLQRSKEIVNLPNKQLWTERLRNWMINATQELDATRLWLANIPDVESELAQTTEKRSESGGHIIYHGPRDPNDSKRLVDHDTDMNRYATEAIFRAKQVSQTANTEDELIKSMGWAGPLSAWSAPYEPPTPRNADRDFSDTAIRRSK